MNVEEKLKDICGKNRIPSCHSNFQIANFIIGKETSLVGRQWQCLRELQSRKDNLDLLAMELQELDDNIELSNLDLDRLNNKLSKLTEVEFKHKKLKIYVRKQERKIQKLKKGKIDLIQKKNDLENEAKIFLEIFESLVKETGFLDFNDPKAQLEYWNRKFETEINLHQVLGLAVSPELIKSVMALPEASVVRVKVLDALTNINKKLLQQSN